MPNFYCMFDIEEKKVLFEVLNKELVDPFCLINKILTHVGEDKIHFDVRDYLSIIGALHVCTKNTSFECSKLHQISFKLIQNSIVGPKEAKVNGNQIAIKADEECSICFEKLQDRQLSNNSKFKTCLVGCSQCLTHYHWGCVSQMTRQQCPMCRQMLSFPKIKIKKKQEQQQTTIESTSTMAV